MATRSCCSIPHTAAAGVRSATSEPAPCRSTKHSNASATIHTSWNYGRPTSERPQLIDTHDEYRSLETTVQDNKLYFGRIKSFIVLVLWRDPEYSLAQRVTINPITLKLISLRVKEFL